jgi:hypothetical protein
MNRRDAENAEVAKHYEEKGDKITVPGAVLPASPAASPSNSVTLRRVFAFPPALEVFLLHQRDYQNQPIAAT